MNEKREDDRRLSQCGFNTKNRKGQFFIIAAVVIMITIISVVTISNYTSTREEVKLYDLGQEIGIESQQVIDSGTYSNLNNEQMTVLLENFANNYVSYIQEDKNIYFIFGNKEEIHVLGYQEIVDEEVCVKINDESLNCQLTNIGTGESDDLTPVTQGAEIENVIVTIGADEHQFQLQEGENFYFVVWREIQGDKHVVTSNDS